MSVFLGEVNKIRFRIISVGKIREKFYRQGIDEYTKRLGAYTKIEMFEGLEERLNPNASPKEIERLLNKEGAKILNLVDQDDILAVLDIEGKMLSSREFADYIDGLKHSGKTRVNFVIGASYGVAPEIKKRADVRISFSPLTFPHQMAVLILTEQLYRAFKILQGEPYHK